MLSVVHETGGTGWFSSNPNKAVVIHISFGTHLLQEPPQNPSFTGIKWKGEEATRLLPWVLGVDNLPETPALLSAKAKTRATYSHHNYLQNMETKSALSQEFCED